MDTKNGFRTIDPALVDQATFRHIDERQLGALRSKLAAANLGGLVLTVDTPPQLDMVADVLFRVAPNTPLLSAIGLVVRVDQTRKTANVRLLRMVVAESQAVSKSAEGDVAAGEQPAEESHPSPVATRILQDGKTLTIIGDFNIKATDAFQAAWQEIMDASAPHITIDLTRVHRISSVAIGLLVSAQMDVMQVSRTLTVRVPVSLERIFRVSRVDKVLRFVYVSPQGEEEVVGAAGDDESPPPAPPDTQTYLRQIEAKERDRS